MEFNIFLGEDKTLKKWTRKNVLAWLNADIKSKCKALTLSWPWQIRDIPEGDTKLKGYGRQPFIWSNVSKKVHENEEKFYRDRRRVSLRCPLNTPMMVLHE